MYYRLYVNDIDFQLWNCNTITLNDYSVQLIINERLLVNYYAYESVEFRNNTSASQHEKLSRFIKHHLNSRLQQLARLKEEFKG
jgi:hypothetical protein